MPLPTGLKLYRVTYVESVLREVYVAAYSAQKANDFAIEQQQNAEHHHAINIWCNDWQAEPAGCSPVRRAACYECRP